VRPGLIENLSVGKQAADVLRSTIELFSARNSARRSAATAGDEVD
jgi:hypothetical protein